MNAMLMTCLIAAYKVSQMLTMYNEAVLEQRKKSFRPNLPQCMHQTGINDFIKVKS